LLTTLVRPVLVIVRDILAEDRQQVSRIPYPLVIGWSRTGSTLCKTATTRARRRSCPTLAEPPISAAARRTALVEGDA
jgi:hypothetical protein